MRMAWKNIFFSRSGPGCFRAEEVMQLTFSAVLGKPLWSVFFFFSLGCQHRCEAASSLPPPHAHRGAASTYYQLLERSCGRGNGALVSISCGVSASTQKKPSAWGGCGPVSNYRQKNNRGHGAPAWCN